MTKGRRTGNRSKLVRANANNFFNSESVYMDIRPGKEMVWKLMKWEKLDTGQHHNWPWVEYIGVLHIQRRNTEKIHLSNYASCIFRPSMYAIFNNTIKIFPYSLKKYGWRLFTWNLLHYRPMWILNKICLLKLCAEYTLGSYVVMHWNTI